MCVKCSILIIVTITYCHFFSNLNLKMWTNGVTNTLPHKCTPKHGSISLFYGNMEANDQTSHLKEGHRRIFATPLELAIHRHVSTALKYCIFPVSQSKNNVNFKSNIKGATFANKKVGNISLTSLIRILVFGELFSLVLSL